MTRYVHAPNNVVASYPYSYQQLLADNPDVSFPREAGDWLATVNVYPVVSTPRPANTVTKNYVEGTPVRTNGVWTQTWVEVDASPEEVASRTERASQDAELDAAQLDAWIIAFLGMTPQGAMNYINANGATLAALRINVARLAYAVRVLVRREFKK